MKNYLSIICVFSLGFVTTASGLSWTEEFDPTKVSYDSMPPKEPSLDNKFVEQRLDRIDTTLVKLRECLADSDQKKATTIRKEINRLKVQKKRFKKANIDRDDTTKQSSSRVNNYQQKSGVPNNAHRY